jgi:hypothetical protein
MTKKIAAVLLFFAAGSVLFAQTEGDFEFEIEIEGGIGDVIITRYTGRSGTVRIPEKLGGERVSVIGEDAFNPNVSGGQALTSVTFPPPGEVSIIIGKNAFANNRLARLTLPAGAGIGENAFANNRLIQLALPADVSIGTGAFRSNSITSLTLPDGIRVGTYAFANNQITTVKIGRDVSLDDTSIDLNFPSYYESRGRAPGTYIYQDKKWNTEQEIKDRNRLKELQDQLRQEQNRQSELEKQLEQERKKQGDIRRQIEAEEQKISDLRETPVPSTPDAGFDFPDSEWENTWGLQYELGAFGFGVGFAFNIGFSFLGDNVGLGFFGDGTLSVNTNVFLLGYSIAAMADLFFMDDWGDPGWGFIGGYGHQGSFFNLDDSDSFSGNFWRVGIRKHTWLDIEMFSFSLFFDYFDQMPGWSGRVGIQLMFGFD